ncbi:MAG TPA: SDR family oxidoreductase [Actinophytocola sp.]|uniref:SDR family oxidoreductase n=1 Tax=Actinophytocola sp. TaxID=1872138 RepID=UPI002DBFA8C5|nr:SDR family oxidoreductase [Actinophytocola sp.]HEU5476114.1 SDR family oxidoreductase [Actinophytocola sp.]
MALDLTLDGTVALVTGGVRGVGLGITRAFQRSGATVVTCARNAPAHPVAEFVACDVRDPDAVGRLLDTVLDRHGRLDTLVNNAGGTPVAPAGTASPRFHTAVVGLNLLAPLLVSQRANEIMQRQESGGAIVMVSSVSATRPSPGTAAYGAAKAGLDNLTASLAVEWAPKVRVNALDVGPVRTERAESYYGDVDAVGRTIPLGRLAEPEEVGCCAVFLASPLAGYVSGATLLVHGGGGGSERTV